jgi:steroid delta-isomerase-like uncharacterized protein
MSIEENKVIMRRYFEESNDIQGNPSKVLAIIDKNLAPDFVQRDPSGNMPLEIFKQYNIALVNAFPDLNFTIDDMIAERDTVVTRYTMTGTHKGEFSGIPPTGNSFSITGVDISRITNGKCVEGWGYADRLGMLQQLGVIPRQ